MSQIHVVQQGECLSSIARDFGFSDWRTIYNDPHNAEFRRKRPNPDLIFPGDELFIPDRTPPKHGCQTGQRHSFQVKRLRAWLRLKVCDEQGGPIAGRPYRLVVGDQTHQGTTTSDGLVEQKIAADASAGELTVFTSDLGERGGRLRWTLAIGALDPVEEVSGVQGRLGNLGFLADVPSGFIDWQTQMALRTFQRASALDPSGQVDAETRKALVAQHGGT